MKIYPFGIDILRIPPNFHNLVKQELLPETCCVAPTIHRVVIFFEQDNNLSKGILQQTHFY